MIDAAVTVGSKIVRAVLGSAADRKPGPLSRHIESMVTVLRRSRPKAMDAGVKIAIENHAGDMQSHQLKTLIEEAGKDFVGACLDSGNPLWTLEDPLVALETLYPYVLTSHVRDSAVWRVPAPNGLPSAATSPTTPGRAWTWVTLPRSASRSDMAIAE